MRKSISELNIGDLVTDGSGEFARVKQCVHGNFYYGSLGSEKNILHNEDATQDEIDSAIEVFDLYEDHIPCCS